jgi:Calcineurin-like phosphoesterase/RTX calcium-binding nonapeptide repeat (4 copies)
MLPVLLGVALGFPSGGLSPAAFPVSCNGESVTIVGSLGPDTIEGTSRPDVVVGLGGHDVIRGKGGDDTLCGGAGADQLDGGVGSDTVRGAEGNDSLIGGFGADHLYGGGGTDTCPQGPGGGRRVACEDPVIAAAGDIACDPRSASFNGGDGTSAACHMMATSDLLLEIDPDAVLALGDNQYADGALTRFQQSYGPSWGRLREVTRPVPGNHDYGTEGASGYFAYFGTVAGDPDKGYYSFDLGGWHIVALNSNCAEVGGCDAGSPQEVWLRQDLAQHPTSCTIAYWHHPRFSSGLHGDNLATDAFWWALHDAGAEMILTGHDHMYERYAPQTPDAVVVQDGIRQFVVGTGGRSHYRFEEVDPNSRARESGTFGVLEVVLFSTGYEWRFEAESGSSYIDVGAGICH